MLIAAACFVTAPASAAAGSGAAAAEFKARASIVGGYYPHPSQWPWATLTVLSDRRYQGNDFERKFCTATLISPTRVLTAAHCVANETASELTRPASDYQVLVGRRRASDNSQGERIDVTGIAVHPEYYGPNSGAYIHQNYHDLAVMFLARPATYQPAVIGAPNDWRSVMTAMGWGHTNHDLDVTSDDLKAADLYTWTDEQCSDAVDQPNRQFYFPTIHICAGGDGANGVCHGDSGGALMVTYDNGMTWKLIGVTSFYPPGAHCTSQGVPTGFAWAAGSKLRDWPLTVPHPPVPAEPPPPDTTAPTIGSLRVSPRRFRAANRGATIAAPRSSWVSFNLSEASMVAYSFKRRVCRRRCRYRKAGGVVRRVGQPGANRVSFSGRLRGRKMRKGRYRLFARATDGAGNRSPLMRTGFRIVKR